MLPIMYAREQAIIATPIGMIELIAYDSCLVSLTIGSNNDCLPPVSMILRSAIVQLEQWFAGEIHSFDLAVMPLPTLRGNILRQAITAIGYGETRSYGALAQDIGSAPRAIGQACARNPLPIIVPCHRVLPAGGALGAYSGGNGSVTKAWLLAHEQRHARPTSGQPGLRLI